MEWHALFCAWIGIDVSKKFLDVCIRLLGGTQEEFRVPNTAAGFAEILKRVRGKVSPGAALFCVESTGGYEFDLASFLCRAGEHVSVVNPAWIKHYANSRGYRNKTDRADARTIAEYAQLMKPGPWYMSDPLRREICQLHRHRTRLMEEFSRVGNWLEHRTHHGEFEVRQQLALRDVLAEQISSIEGEIERLIESDEETKQKVLALLPLKGMGMVFAVALVCEMGDVKNYECAQQYAAQIGVNPCRRESGDQKKKSCISKAGNGWVRAAGWLPAGRAMQCNEPIQDLCARLKEKGLQPKQVRTAAMRKLVMQAYGVLSRLSRGEEPFYGKPGQESEKDTPGQPNEKNDTPQTSPKKINKPPKVKLKFRVSTSRTKAKGDTYENPKPVKETKKKAGKDKPEKKSRGKSKISRDTP